MRHAQPTPSTSPDPAKVFQTPDPSTKTHRDLLLLLFPMPARKFLEARESSRKVETSKSLATDGHR